MVSLILKWFKNLSIVKKISVVVIFVLVLIISSLSILLARSEYLRLKAIESEFKESREDFEDSDAKQVEIVEKVKEKALKVSSKNENINKKIKEDEKIIDSDSVSNDELLEYITKHENQNR